MRFHWFHLMPYPFLPDDFKQKYRSVWVDVPSALYDPEKGHWLYNEYLDQLEFADGLGFDGICVNEHHQNAYGLMPSPNLMGAALTRRTSKAALVVMGNMPDALARENTQRFAADVMPHLRALWTDYEDHWYPKTLTQERHSSD
jgi:hypothetical protein